MNYSIPLHAVIADRSWETALFSGDAGAVRQTFRAWWSSGAADHDLGAILSFNGQTSFAGTHAVITIPWSAEKNPRTNGPWWCLLVPDDGVRVNVRLMDTIAAGARSGPLMLGIPMPDGASENYGGHDTIDLRLEDITGPASRRLNYPVPPATGATVDAWTAASTILGGIPFICTYPLKPVDSCLDRFPNALMAADDVLIAQQDKLNPLTGKKRIRYGDRDGKIIYRLVEAPDIGAPFGNLFPSAGYEFTFTATDILAGMEVAPRYLRFHTRRVNPYLDLGSRIRVEYPRAGLDEVVEVHEIGWRSSPAAPATQTLKCRRQYTL